MQISSDKTRRLPAGTLVAFPNTVQAFVGFSAAHISARRVYLLDRHMSVAKSRSHKSSDGVSCLGAFKLVDFVQGLA